MLIVLLFFFVCKVFNDEAIRRPDAVALSTCGFFSDIQGRDLDRARDWERFCGTDCGAGPQVAPANKTGSCPAHPNRINALLGYLIDGAIGLKPDSQVRWGESMDLDLAGQSGFGFTGQDVVAQTDGTPFPLGRFSHFNHPVFGFITSVSLTMVLRVVGAANCVECGVCTTHHSADAATGAADASPTATTETFSLTIVISIDETPNTDGHCPYPSDTPCSDKVYSSLRWPGDVNGRYIYVAGHPFRLRLLGWAGLDRQQQQQQQQPVITEPSNNDAYENMFISQEGRETDRWLFASLEPLKPTSPNEEPTETALLWSQFENNAATLTCLSSTTVILLLLANF